MKKAIRIVAMIAVMMLVAAPFAVFFYCREKCRQDTHSSMVQTGYAAKYKITAVHFEGIEWGKVEFDGGSSDYGLWLLFAPQVIDIQTGKKAHFKYDQTLRQTPSFDCTHMMPIVSWDATEE